MMIQDPTLKTRSEANPADTPPHIQNKQKRGIFQMHVQVKHLDLH